MEKILESAWLQYNSLHEPVLPDGRNFGQKAQKGPEKNKVGRKIWWPNFARLWPKMAEKGPEKI